ncbi:MAG: hypothetical protein ABIT04_12045 [Novosphingobium sp.]
MTEPTSTFGSDDTLASGGAGTAGPATDAPKAHFAKAVEEARAGAQAMREQAQERAETYLDKIKETQSGWTSDARARGDEARERVLTLANDGKVRATGAINNLAKTVEDSAPLIDERLGVKYGDYVRGASRSLQDAAIRLEAADLTKVTEDTRAFVRSSPGLAVGIAAMGGFLIARLFKGSDS